MSGPKKHLHVRGGTYISQKVTTVCGRSVWAGVESTGDPDKVTCQDCRRYVNLDRYDEADVRRALDSMFQAGYYGSMKEKDAAVQDAVMSLRKGNR